MEFFQNGMDTNQLARGQRDEVGHMETRHLTG